MRLSDQIRFALAKLHESHRFDLVAFPERGALGFRSIQAKRMGMVLGDVPLLVVAHGPSQWQRQYRQQWLDQDEQLYLAFCEHYAFAQADNQQVAQPAVRDFLRELGWDTTHVISDDDLLGRAGGVNPLMSAPNQGVNTPRSPESLPLVTICIPFLNLGHYLPATLAALAHQSYANMEVLVIDDGSSETASHQVFQELSRTYPQYRFITQANTGIGATRNRGLAEARGEYFLPMDADNLAHPDLVQRLVRGLERNPGLAALSCYFLAFAEIDDIAVGRFAYSYRPTGGPHLLGCLKNVYGDGTALFRTVALRAVGGFETDRDSSWEDWELFVKLVNAGFQVDVIPEVLFYYRHRTSGFSRVTEAYRNHQRVLRQYIAHAHWPLSERKDLWNYLAGLQRRVEELENENRSLRRRLQAMRYRLADHLQRWVEKLPLVKKSFQRMLGR